MDAIGPHPALDPAVAWPTLGMWVRWDGGRLDLVSLAPTRDAQADQVLLPCDPELLIQLGKISLGRSRAGPYAVRLVQEGTDHRVVLCRRGSEGAIRISGTGSSMADPLYAKTRAAMLAAGREHRAEGNQDEAAQWSAMARQLLMTKRLSRRGRSIRTISGGLPTFGKHG
ncbi:hypothetical protein ACIREO_22695 [Streptomyces sp. NPDC102441]|uniref:hypothetical protein n=1 Tax=Streptomyces sp. NPDC102441 TaxID=3366176 RepID=UPI003804148F